MIRRQSREAPPERQTMGCRSLSFILDLFRFGCGWISSMVLTSLGDRSFFIKFAR